MVGKASVSLTPHPQSEYRDKMIEQIRALPLMQLPASYLNARIYFLRLGGLLSC